LHQLDDAGHRHRLAASGHAEQRLGAVAARDSLRERFRGLRLIAGKTVR